ncbi:unnamed protein product [Aspergillus oryzae RIB40]|uniref:DNA, Q47Con0163 n=1 Tax=Aspergillus oryzae (strain ATCC 42149 / RIB 40) TaxID=510516 RepID=Q2TVX3_ASPOR|nr:uncharacterized protein AO090663000006 [Aspergillus oryzae RIB40]BAE66600.1 unnamed protein product [Aspergillus oryzae RIB40]
MKTKAETTDILDDWVVSRIDHSYENPNFGFVETLYQTCSAALKSTLKKDIASIQFWEENFPVGHLDTILAESSGLKIRVLENLRGIGKILIAFFTDYDEVIFSTQNERNPECNFANDLLIQVEKAALMLDVEEKSERSSDDETDDDSSPATERIYTPCSARRKLNMFRLRLLFVCLIVRNPTPCVFATGRCPYRFHFSHTDIYARFANAPTSLVERLAEANLQRSIRLRTQEEEKEEVDDHTNHDSGLGTSIPTMSQYAATVASHTSFLSVAGEEALGRPRVPPLPQEGGRPFRCDYCHRTISMRNRIEWKMHVFADLESYICTHEDCRDVFKTFPTRQLWADHEFNAHFTLIRWRCFICSIALNTAERFVEHLAQEHGSVLTGHCVTAATSEARETVLTPGFGNYKCLLCLQDGWHTRKGYTTHVGRHLEEISLACLPRDEEDSSDDDLDTNISHALSDVDEPTSTSGESYGVDANSTALTPAPQGNPCIATDAKIELGVHRMAEATLPQEKEAVEKNAPPHTSHPRGYLGRAKEGMYVFGSTEAEPGMATTEPSEVGYGSLPTSHWSVHEQRDFPRLLAHFGRDFEGISNFMKSKTPVMVKNYYQRRLDSGNRYFEETALTAEERKSRGEPTGPLPVLNAAPMRHYGATRSTIAPHPPAPHGHTRAPAGSMTGGILALKPSAEGSPRKCVIFVQCNKSIVIVEQQHITRLVEK